MKLPFNFMTVRPAFE